MCKKFQEFVNNYSYKARYKKELSEFIEKVNQYSEMDDNEFLLTYCNVSAAYKHKQMLLSILSISFIISIVANIWKYFYNLIIKAIDFSTSLHDERIINIAILISGVVIFLLIIMVMVLIFSFLRELNQLYKKKILLENMKERRKRGSI